MPARFTRRQVLTAAALAPLASVIRSTPAAADEAAPGGMGTVGLVDGQSLVVSAFHHASDGGFTPCGVVIAVDSIEGERLLEQKATLFPRTGVVATYAPPLGTLVGKTRQQVHASVTFEEGHPVGATAQLVDRSGRTQGGFVPCGTQTALEMATLGLVRGQIARLSAFHHGPVDKSITPCGIVFSLVGLDGKAVLEEKATVVPGTGTFVDFAPPSFLKPGQRVEVHAEVRYPTGHPIGMTLEIFDASTGELTGNWTPCGVADQNL
jgi:hypothetical protein